MKDDSQNKNRLRLMEVGSSSQTAQSIPQLGSLLEAISKYRVLVVGDSIYDEYVYVTPLGMSAKESILVVEANPGEQYLYRGGALAAVDHLRGFCRTVDLIEGRWITKKTRYVGQRKMFEVHSKEAANPAEDLVISSYDLVVVADFGHGCITDELKGKTYFEGRYLAVNCQTNAANRGFNLVTKYPKADYVVLDSLEARLATQDRTSPIEDVVLKLGFKKMVVTQGSDGAIGYDGKFHYSRARAKKVVDTMGAGDAFFAVTAPLACAGADMPTLLAVGNAAAAVKCASVGQCPVDKQSLLEAL